MPNATHPEWPGRRSVLVALETMRQHGAHQIETALVKHWAEKISGPNSWPQTQTARALHQLAEEGLLVKRYFVECTEGCENSFVEWDLDAEAELFCPLCDELVALPKDASDLTTRFYLADTTKPLVDPTSCVREAEVELKATFTYPALVSEHEVREAFEQFLGRLPFQAVGNVEFTLNQK